MIMKDIPRNEYPRPQMVRDEWLNLNGEWDFCFDFGKSGKEQKWYQNKNMEQKIIVPFCPESKLSGIQHVDFMPAVWYKRTVVLSKEQLSKTVLIHFGAVDYQSDLWVNGIWCGAHTGGYTPFSFNITDKLHDGENVIVVSAIDENRTSGQVIGKQCPTYASVSCSYSRTTGIWQTVWLEFVPDSYIESYKLTPQLQSSNAVITVKTVNGEGCSLRCIASFEGKQMGSITAAIAYDTATAIISLSELHLWEVGASKLYDLSIELIRNTETTDIIAGYFGMRSIAVKSDGVYINGKPVFMRMVLNQGYNPDGIYTSPTDEYMKRDIELCMKLGFNGARFHQTVFEERALYWADRLGYIVWGEHAQGGNNSAEASEAFLPQWIDAVNRDYNHPSIIGWCPFNESYWIRNLDTKSQELTYQITKCIDQSRPVIDASGGFHTNKTDIFDVHDYEQCPEVLKQSLAKMLENKNYVHNPIHNKENSALSRSANYLGQPVFMSEYGGAWWNPDINPKTMDDTVAWGYGNQPANEDEVIDRYVGLTKVLLDNPRICGFAYTELFDVEQEQNGMYNCYRQPKFSEKSYERILKTNLQKAAIEIGQE